jgi:hypothetical protein
VGITAEKSIIFVNTCDTILFMGALLTPDWQAPYSPSNNHSARSTTSHKKVCQYELYPAEELLVSSEILDELGEDRDNTLGSLCGHTLHGVRPPEIHAALALDIVGAAFFALSVGNGMMFAWSSFPHHRKRHILLSAVRITASATICEAISVILIALKVLS